MSHNNFDDVLASLKDVEDQATLQKLLIELRKRVDVDCPNKQESIAKIIENGSLRYLITFLHVPKKGILNISLSILGNCCLDPKCARDLINQFGVLPTLNQLLKRFPKEDSINGRVFRIVGNLCQQRDNWATMIINKKPQIIMHLVKYLKNSVEKEEGEEDTKVSEATITMGVRCLRVLLNKQTLETLVETYEVLKTVGMLLIKYGSVWESTKKCEGVVTNIVRLLHEYSRYRYYPSIVEMRNTSQGDSIAYLSKILLIAPRQVVKIVMNFLKISKLKSDLPVPEIFDSFVKILRDDSIIKEFSSTCEECIKCLCHLLDHPGNRENERCGDSIPLLVNVLKGLSFDSHRKIECCFLIVSTLSKCKYNKSLINAQLKCNIVTVLIEKINMIVGSAEPFIVNHKSDRKRKINYIAMFEIGRNKKKRLSYENNEFELKSSSSSSEEEADQFDSGTRFDYSPASSNESEVAMSWTSGLSPQSSPRSQRFGFSETDSDDYSPVCSEVDPAEFALPGVVIEDEDPEWESKHCDDILEEIEGLPSFAPDCTNFKQIKGKLILEILDLIKTYAKLKPIVTQLGKPELLLGLVKCAMVYDWPHSSPMVDIIDVVDKILETHDYLLPLMKSDFIPAVYDLSNMQHGIWCSKCRVIRIISITLMKRVTKIAESGGGKGDIAHKLLRGDNATKEQLVLAIPYIIRNRNTLIKLLLNCGGLEILMRLLHKESPLQMKSVKVLCVLASKKLGIPNPKRVPNYCKALPEYEGSSTPAIVTFQLDDGSLLTAEREVLSKSSDYFARLLDGDFKESNQDTITLPNATNQALTYLLDYIKCDPEKTEIVVDEDVDLNTLLEVISLCDRFLLEDYRAYFTDNVERCRFASDTIPIIYNWSLGSRTNLLRVECIAFALVGDIVDSARYEMFKQLFQLGYTEELVEDIRKLLVRYMTVNQVCDLCEGKKGKNRLCDKSHCI